MKFTDEVRKQIKERSKERCEVCGALALHPQIHHRRPRGMGGSRKMDTNQCANALVLHPACHAKVESNRKQSLLNGWLVSQHAEPIDVAVKLHYGWYWLTHDGEAIPHDLSLDRGWLDSDS